MIRRNGRRHGEVFTQLNVVSYILDEVEYFASKNLQNTTVLEPAAGEGVFAIEIIKRLWQSSKKHSFDFIKALNSNIRIIELDIATFLKLIKNVVDCVERLGYSEQMLEPSVFSNADFLQKGFDLKFDCIVGNPPYIRHERIDSDLKDLYRKNFVTFRYRADLYVLFYEKSLKLLSEKGLLSFICSNRWLFNQYGRPLRRMIAKEYHLSKVINIEKARIFDEEVIAYPCITTIRQGKGELTEYFESQEREIDISSINFELIDSPKDDSWQNLFLDYDINHILLDAIEKQGFEIGIGVATGADEVYIKNEGELGEIEKCRLLPLVRSNCVKGANLNWDNTYVINPFSNGALCDLDKYPQLKNYLESKKELLINRHIAKKSPKQWYKTIDKIKPDLQKKNKLLLPDLSGCKFLFIDEGNYYPHHNLYYITHLDLNQLKILAAILMSDFIKEQLSQIGIRMNDGLPRFQAQTLKKLRIPILEELDIQDREALVESYEKRDYENLNRVINKYCAQHLIKVMPESVVKTKPKGYYQLKLEM